jgi:hypothetical protein
VLGQIRCDYFQCAESIASATSHKKNMKHKLIHAGVYVAITMAGSQALAQAKSFEGFSLAGGINIANNNFSRSAGALSSSVSSNSIDSTFQAQYDLAASEQLLIGMGATADHGELVFGRWVLTGRDIRMKDRYSLFVAPGYAIDDSTMVYAKLAYISGTVYDPASTILPGTGYGVGMKIKGGSNVFYQAEFSTNRYANREY